MPTPADIDSPSPPAYRFVQHGARAITHLYSLPASDINGVDLAEMNLISAYGLPGTRGMDMRAMLATLDGWAQRVADFTAQTRRTFYQRRQEFGTLARFQVAAMLRTLTRDCGIRYSPDRIADPENFDDPEDSFIHGLLGPHQTGTCASLPVLLVAVGRRLGYPMHLCLAPAHCFCRWDGRGEWFNIEYHEGGLNSHDDEHYRRWPEPWTQRLGERERGNPTFLINLTPQQELAYCAHTRASQLDVAGRRAEAVAVAHVARRLWPTHANSVWVTHLTTKLMYPERKFPHIPSEETAGTVAIARLVREKGAVVVGGLSAVRSAG